MAGSAPPSPPICRVCDKQFSRYACPRCNTRYCSLPCYTSHSHGCVESFMRDNVLAEMRGLSPPPQSKRRMLEALRRLHMESDMDPATLSDNGDDVDMEDEGHASPSSSTLSEITLRRIAAGELVEFEDLTPEEKKSFLHAIASGKLSHMIRPWDPWWLNPSARTLSLTSSGNSLVQPMDSEKKWKAEGLDESDNFDIPLPPESPLLSVKQLTSVQLSPLLGVHLVEVVYSYCFTLRLFNGDWHADPLDASMTCLTVSQVLCCGELPESLRGALQNCVGAVCSPCFKSAGGRRFGLALLDDVLVVMYLGRPGIICLLADLYRLLQSALESFKQECRRVKISGRNVRLHGKVDTKQTVTGSKNPLSKTGQTDQKRLHSACRKAFFLMCWVNEQASDVFSSLALLIEGERAGLIGVENEMNNGLIIETANTASHSHHVSEKVDTGHSKKFLIQEL